MDINISKFELDNLKVNRLIHIIGPRASGKTTLLKNILDFYTNHHEFRKIIVFSLYPQDLRCSQKIKYIEDYDENYLEKSINKQLSLIRKDGFQDKNKLLLIMEDQNFDLSKSQVIRKIMMNSRHYNMTFILSSQYSSLPPSIRSNFDYVFSTKDQNKNNLNRLYQHYYGAFPTFALFDDVFSSLENYEFLVMDNTRLTLKIQECVFWYKIQSISERQRVGNLITKQYTIHDYIQEMLSDNNGIDKNLPSKYHKANEAIDSNNKELTDNDDLYSLMSKMTI